MTQHEGLEGFTDPQVPIRLQGPKKVLRRSGNILLKMFSSKVFPEKHRGSILSAKAAAWYHFTVTTLENKPPADLMWACSFFSREMTSMYSNIHPIIKLHINKDVKNNILSDMRWPVSQLSSEQPSVLLESCLKSSSSRWELPPNGMDPSSGGDLLLPSGRVLFSVLLDGQRTEATACTDAEAS